MNKEKLLILADHIEGLPHKKGEYIPYPSPAVFPQTYLASPTTFHMEDWHCGSAACIGGWAEFLFLDKSAHFSWGETREVLGLTTAQVDALFFPPVIDYEPITPSVAAATIRRLVETGEVTWEISDA